MKCINIHHVGIWVDNMDEAISFYIDVMGFRLLTRNPRGSIGPGERAIIHIGDQQMLELLTEPNVTPRPDFPVHPAGHVVGIPHICLRVTDIPAWRQKLQSCGYTVSEPFPETGFMHTELGLLRLAFFTGPGGVGFELFEFEEENPYSPDHGV
ncbi:MAG: Glyoxalase/Bleomycin resistance protein/Dioxygenase superfamily protein [Syntrophorhabdus sp. PtaU1.Bin058]|nr:MAG: Glyoxalase/Bleomycin resistance protein/Dioxygenase superfamily protein [Syntrophorhabdus sp. PtaU1.Bin058]